MQRKVTCSQRLPRMLGFKVTGTGTAAITQGAQDATLVDNGAGTWTLTFTKAFTRAPICVATSMTATTYCEVSAASTTAVTVLAKTTAANVSTDAVFQLLVLGYDSADET